MSTVSLKKQRELFEKLNTARKAYILELCSPDFVPQELASWVEQGEDLSKLFYLQKEEEDFPIHFALPLPELIEIVEGFFSPSQKKPPAQTLSLLPFKRKALAQLEKALAARIEEEKDEAMCDAAARKNEAQARLSYLEQTEKKVRAARLSLVLAETELYKAYAPSLERMAENCMKEIPPGADKEGIIQEMALVMMRAADVFDASLPLQFSSFFYDFAWGYGLWSGHKSLRGIKISFQKSKDLCELRQKPQSLESPATIEAELGCTPREARKLYFMNLDQPQHPLLLTPSLPDEKAQPIPQSLAERDLKRSLDEALETLRPRYRAVVEARLGFKTGDPMTFDEIAQLHGFTGCRAQQIYAKATRKHEWRRFERSLLGYN